MIYWNPLTTRKMLTKKLTITTKLVHFLVVHATEKCFGEAHENSHRRDTVGVSGDVATQGGPVTPDSQVSPASSASPLTIRYTPIHTSPQTY